MLLITYGLPRTEITTCLTAIDDAVGIGFVVGVITIFSVIVAYHIHSFRIIRFVTHYHPCQSSRYGARRVHGTYAGRQALGNLTNTFGMRTFWVVTAKHGLADATSVKHRMRVGVVGVVHLISYAPKEYARVIAVTAYDVGDVAFDPFLEEVVCALITWFSLVPSLYPLTLRELPFIASLIHDEHTQFIAQIVHDGGLWIMAHAYGIGTHSLELLDATTPHFGRDYSAQYACIVVQAYTFYFHALSVDCKSFVSAKVECTKPCTYLGLVYHFPFDEQFHF